MIKLKKVLSLVLAFVMTASLFSNWPMPVFATEGNGVTIEESADNETVDLTKNGETVVKTPDVTTAYFADNIVTLYEEYRDEAHTAEVKGAAGTKVYLYDEITFGDNVLTIYKYVIDDSDITSDQSTVMSRYPYIAAEDIVFDESEVDYTQPSEEPSPEPSVQPSEEPSPEPSAEPTPIPLPAIVLESLPRDAILNAEAPSGALAVINGTTLPAYKSLDNGATGVEIPVEEGTVVELITAYTLKTEEADFLFYRYDYTGSNEILAQQAISEHSGHVFISADAVTISAEVGENSYTNEEYGITVSGIIPSGLTLDVAPEEVNDVLESADALMGGDNWTYDVDLTYPGGEYKTTQGIDVTFEKENVQIPIGTQYKAYHINSDNTVDVLGPFTYDGNDIALTFNSLSPVGLSADVTILNSRPFEKGVFANSTVTVYPSDAENDEPKTITGLTSSDIITLVNYSPFGYKLADGTTRYYIYAYEGSNPEAAFLNKGSMYRVDINDIKEYIEPTPTPTPIPTPDTTPVIPEKPTLTEGADVSIVDGTGVPVTDAGFKIREGTKVSLSAWTGLTDVGDETYQWQISSEETAGYWVNINGQKSKGLLMSLAMVNSMTVPSIRCKIVTGGVTKYSMAIPVTPLEEKSFTDNSSNVSVAGILPSDATLTVSAANLDDTGLNNGVYPVGNATLLNDVTLYRGGNTYQPEEGETVTVTFPESSVTGKGFAAGDAYHVYHIHDGVVDLSEIRYYNGGNVEMTFSNLSVVGISEATPAEKDLVEQHGAIISEESLSPSQIMYVKNDSVVLYDTPEATETATAYVTTVAGCAGAEVEAYQKITYTDNFVVYRVRGTDNTPSDLDSTLTAYPIISADDLSEESTGEPTVINTCAICGKEMGTECVTPHVYCTEHKVFDCVNTHEKPVTEKPITAPVIPANPTLTEGADVSIVDVEGNAITAQTGLAVPEGTRTSISAWSDLENSGNAAYQWQIRYDGENWTNIQGKTEKGLVVSPAMVNSITDPALRCEIKSGDTVQYSDPIPVTVETPTALAADFAKFNLARMSNGIATVADEPVLNEYSIVINYVFDKNNEIVADPYTATLAAGSNFSATVTHPVIQGYLPYIGTDTETSTKIDLNITNIQADVTYTVKYKPTNVDYTVIYYHQNIDNDNYTEAERVTKQGLTGTKVPAVGKVYPGFYELLYEQPEIAADGSTVVEVYYDRIYYLMLFNLGEGGYGVDPIYDRYGAPIADVGTPTREGYTFNGWDKTIPLTMPVDGGRYTAQWTPQQTTYTVVYWKENADDSNYSYWGQESKTALSGSTVSGSDSIPASITTTTVDGKSVNERPYFTYNAAKTDTDVVVKGEGSTVVNVYYYRNTYTVYFTGISGKCAIEEHTHGTNCNSYLDCLKSEHTHDESCTKVLTCIQDEHTHDGDCSSLICTIPAHGEHSDACLICDKPVHESHTDDCCTIAPHTHSADCCVIEAHTHDSTCYCSLEEHTHSVNGCGWFFGYLCGKSEHTHGDECCTKNLEAHTHGTGSCTCATPEHVHGGSSCTCNIEIHYHSEDQGCYSDVIHQHGEGCYGLTCGYVAHTHTDACYTYTCGGEPHNHTDSCYRPCTKREHTHTNSCNNNSTNNVIYVVTAKYEQTIGDVWPTAANFPNITFRGWSIDGIDATATSKRINMTSDLCDTSDNLKYARANTGGSKKYLYYMFESFDQTSPVNGNERILRNGVYYDKSELYYQEVNSSGNWNQKEIAGMAPVSNGVVESGSNVFLYYTRNRSNLMYHNVTGVVKTVTSIMYEQPLVNYKDNSGNLLSDYVPSYPSTLEPGAYEFADWYTTPECYEGTEFNFNTATMPNGDLTLYAKWAPVTRTVTFYIDKETMEDPEGKPLDTRTTPHGSLVFPRVDPPVNGDYTFVSWFYIDEDGQEKAFVFDTMVVTKNMDVYAKWSSNVLKEYIVYFKIQGADTQIADPIIGSTLAGETRTFDAKGDKELYPNYQEGYFPLVESHSMTLDINTPTEANGTDWVEIEDEDGNKKIVQSFTFWYKQKDAVPYTVYYVAETLKENEDPTKYETIVRDGKTYYLIADTYTNSENRKAVVTEKFKTVQGYMPDAYQKRLVVNGSEGAVNELIFFYIVDNVHAYYQITHYTQNTDGATWTEYASSQAQGTIGETYTASPLTIDGFTYDPSVTGTVTSGKLTENGLELKLYYVRNQYPYEVRYLEQGTGKVLAQPKDGTGLYADVISENAIDIADYTAVAPTSQTLVIKIEESQTEAKLNIITFYYTENTATINYVVVGPEGCGTVSPESETLKVLSGTAQGSTATASSNTYKFVGWYSDEACTQPVSTDAKYVPTKENDELWVDGTTYYAKFEYNVGSLVIEKQVVMPSGFAITADEEFSFTVEGDNYSNTVKFKVDANGRGSVKLENLVQGKYTVTEKLKDEQLKRYFAVNQTQDVYVYAGQEVAAVVENKAKTGGFSVEKTIVNEAVNYTPAATEEFEMQVTVTGYTGGALAYVIEDNDDSNDTVLYTDATGKFKIKDGEKALFKDLLVGSTFTVTENLKPEQNTVYNRAITTADKEPENSIYTIEANQTEAITVTNTVMNGDLILEKSVVMPAGFDIPANTEFKFEVFNNKSEKVTEVTLSATNNWTAEISNLLVGNYTVEEIMTDAQIKLYSVDNANKGAVINDEADTSVEFINTAKLGSLAVTKTIVDTDANKAANKDELFEISVTITGVSAGTVLQYKVGEETRNATDNKIKLKNGETAIFNDLPVGVQYEVEEILTSVLNSYYTPSYDDKAKGTIVANTPSSTTVTNTRKYGELTVIKEIGAGTSEPGETFVFTITGPNDFHQEVVIAGAGRVTLTNIPFGTYTVSEDMNWAYKFNADPSSRPVEVSATKDGEAKIVNWRKKDKWLKADAYAENIFEEVSESTNN